MGFLPTKTWLLPTEWGLFPIKSQFPGAAKSMSFTNEDYHAAHCTQLKIALKALIRLQVTQSAYS
jgi:hypothetical protein